MKVNPDALLAYQEESADQLSLVEELILELEVKPQSTEMLNRLFRVFHTIKGSGSMFGFDEVANFTHTIETILDALRTGSLTFDREIANLTLRAKDCLFDMVRDSKLKAPEELDQKFKALSAKLPLQDKTPAPTSNKDTPHSLALKHYKLRVKLAGDVFARGLSPLNLLHDLTRLGECKIRTQLDSIPPLHKLIPEEAYFDWTIELATTHELNAVKDVFIFIEDDSLVQIEQQGDLLGPDEPTAIKAVSIPQLHAAISSSPPSPEEAANKWAMPPPADPPVRVPASRLDELVNLVGELVINHSRLTQLGKKLESPELGSAVEDLERLVSDLRDKVLGIRMTPIGTSFSRFRRLTRDLSSELGKELVFETEGEETELDKTMLDQLGEPLIHLIRNALDHGIGTPEARLQAGKSRMGRLRLSAAHEGAHVVIRLCDDGRGINLEKVRRRAVLKGLIAESLHVQEKELLSVLFEPGFTTAETVSNVSGRGVGLDVVKRQIEQLRGSVSIQSTEGVGTCVELTLPLTLAIIEGLLVSVGDDYYILPLSVVEENCERYANESATGNKRNLITLRGDLIPFLSLREVFETGETGPSIERIVVVRIHGQRLGLVVDRILGSHQTVVQSLGHFYKDTPYVSGATILGDGRAALILNTAGLLAQHNLQDSPLRQKSLLHA